MTTATTARTSRSADRSSRWKDRVDGGDWDHITSEINEYGCALLPRLLTPDEAGRIAALYERDDCFRSTIDMGRHPLRPGRVPVLRAPFPRADRAVEAGPVPATAANRP